MGSASPPAALPTVEPVDANLSAEERKKKALSAREYAFDFDMTCNGRPYKGRFVSVIPDGLAKRSMGAFRVQLAGGVPISHLDAATSDLTYAQATLTFCLKDDENRPEWSKKMDAIVDEDVLYALLKHVEEHRRYFRG